MEILLVVLFIVALTIVPILGSIEARKLNREINLGSWIIKPTFSNSTARIKPKTLGFLLGAFAIFFVLLNVLNII
jgi:hypothetical protein